MRLSEMAFEKGSLLVDIFSGSGTFLKAFRDSGSYYLGIEISENAKNECIEYLGESNQLSLFA